LKSFIIERIRILSLRQNESKNPAGSHFPETGNIPFFPGLKNFFLATLTTPLDFVCFVPGYFIRKMIYQDICVD